jgi:hypothetical protein
MSFTDPILDSISLDIAYLKRDVSARIGELAQQAMKELEDAGANRDDTAGDAGSKNDAPVL